MTTKEAEQILKKEYFYESEKEYEDSLKLIDEAIDYLLEKSYMYDDLCD